MDFKINKLKTLITKFTGGKKQPVEKKYEDTLRSAKLSEDALGLLTNLYETLGPRPAATKDSRRAARQIAALFESYVDEKDVTITSARIYTSISKGVLLSLILITPIILLLNIFNLPLISMAIIAVWTASFILQIRRKRNVFKFLMPSDEAANVHAVLEPDDLVEETVVFTAHHDSASENKIQNYLSWRNFSLYYLPFSGVCVLTITSIVMFILDLLYGHITPGITSVGYIVSSIIGVLLSYSSLFCLKSMGLGYVKGAGDNLSGVSVVVQLARYFASKKKAGKGLKHVRLIFASFDGEECGVQGSEAWFKNNSHLLLNAKVINFDGLYKAKDLAFLTQDGNGLVPLNSTLAIKCAELAHSMGFNIATGKLGIMAGETDAASAAKAGYKATTLTSMRPETKTPAHTHDDTPDKVEIDALTEAISVGIKFVENEDEFYNNRENKENSLSYLEQNKKYRLTK